MRSTTVFCLALVACSPELVVRDGVTIQCTSDDHCPEGYTCLTQVGECFVIGRPDKTGPVLQSVVPLSEIQLELTFSEALGPAGAVDASRYAIEPSLTVELAALVGPPTVQLIVSEQSAGQDYALQVSRIVDLCQHRILVGFFESDFVPLLGRYTDSHSKAHCDHTCHIDLPLS